MSDPVLANVKPGDKLAVSARAGTPRIDVVQRITPSGRVVTQFGTFNPDGYLRGDINPWNPLRARPATEDDIAKIYRAELVRKIGQFRFWDRLGPDQLKAVAALVDKYAK